MFITFKLGILSLIKDDLPLPAGPAKNTAFGFFKFSNNKSTKEIIKTCLL